MVRPAKVADDPSAAVTRGIRIAGKRTFPKGEGVSPPFWTPELAKLDKMVQERKNERKRDAPLRWRRKVLADTALDRWKENVPKLSATDSVSWNLAKSMHAPRPLTSPVLVVDDHPLTKRQQAEALSNICMARSTKAPHAPEMKVPSSRRCAFRPNTEAEMDVALRELSSGTAPGDDEIHCEELKQLGRGSRRCILRLFNCSLCVGRCRPSGAWHHSTAAEAERDSKQHGVLSAGDAHEHAAQADGTHCGAPRQGPHQGKTAATGGRVQAGAIDAGHARAGDGRSAVKEGWREEGGGLHRLCPRL
ncbi:hypothetical protein ERJ75_001299900 [Trypanosoma vivax]|nr:hypothetical protein ERJ75_001299900 [Trypanosoma vivax]